MRKTYSVVMLGCAIGTGWRMMFSQLLATRFGETFPVGTLVGNLTGGLFTLETVHYRSHNSKRI